MMISKFVKHTVRNSSVRSCTIQCQQTLDEVSRPPTQETFEDFLAVAQENPYVFELVSSKLSSKARAELGVVVEKNLATEYDPNAVVSREQLLRLAIWYGAPMIGFGFMDNVVLIMAGCYVDVNICHALGYSTLFAAGIGNLCSDLVGVAAASKIEEFGGKLGIRHHGLHPYHLKSNRCMLVKYAGISLGVAFGCVLGMFPLLIPQHLRFWEWKHNSEARTSLPSCSETEVVFS